METGDNSRVPEQSSDKPLKYKSISQKVTLTGVKPITECGKEDRYSNDREESPKMHDPSPFSSVTPCPDNSSAIKAETKEPDNDTSGDKNGSTRHQAIKISLNQRTSYTGTVKGTTIPVERMTSNPRNVVCTEEKLTGGKSKESSSEKSFTSVSNTIPIRVPVTTVNTQVKQVNTQVKQVNTQVKQVKTPIRFTVSQPTRGTVTQNYTWDTVAYNLTAQDPIAFRVPPVNGVQSIKVSYTPQKVVSSTRLPQRSTSAVSALGKVRPPPVRSASRSSLPLVLKRTNSESKVEEKAVVMSPSGILLSDTKVSNFGTCSYLSPFSNDASVMIIGDNENEMYNIKPRMGSMSISPQLEVQPPTPHLSRNNSRDNVVNDQEGDAKSRELKDRQDTQSGLRGMINAFANALKDPNSPNQDGGDTTSASSILKPRFRIPAVITVVRKDGIIKKSDSFSRKVSLDPSVAKIKRREIDVSVRPRSVSVASESISKSSNEDESKREPHKILKDFLSNVLLKREKPRSRQSVVSMKYLQDGS